jgi:uncharacterized protein YukE
MADVRQQQIDHFRARIHELQREIRGNAFQSWSDEKTKRWQTAYEYAQRRLKELGPASSDT